MTHDLSEVSTGDIRLPSEYKPIGFDVLVRLRSALNRLERRDDIRVIRSEIYHPVSDLTMEMTEAALGHPVPDPILSLYRTFDGVEIEWEYLSADEPIVGKIDLHGLATVFGKWTSSIWGNVEGDDEGRIDDSWHFRGVEGGWSDDGGYRTVFYIADHLPDYSLRLFHPAHRSLRLKGPFHEYLDRLVDTLGIQDWPLLWIAEDALEEAEASERAERAWQQLRTVFPELSMEHFTSPIREESA